VGIFKSVNEVSTNAIYGGHFKDKICLWRVVILENVDGVYSEFEEHKCNGKQYIWIT
jgi:hypothetical protein